MRNRACFEVSWEVANAVGGIHTVIASKSEQMKKTYDDHYFVIGPWLREHHVQQDRVWEDHALDPAAMRALGNLHAKGILVRTGRWKVPGRPFGILIDFSRLWSDKNRILADYWERFGLDSLHGGPDYDEPLLFSIAAGMVVETLTRDWLQALQFDVLLHAHEWLAAGSVLHAKHACPKIACVFTTHATVLGRALASRAHLPEAPLSLAEAQRLAAESGVIAKHSMETIACRVADVFSTVSETTAIECERILGLKPVVLPNALGDDYPPHRLRTREAKSLARMKLLEQARRATGRSYIENEGEEPIIVLTSGRYEFRNKGLDIIAEALGVVQARLGPTRKIEILAFFLVPADSETHSSMHPGKTHVLTHELRHGEHDPLLHAFEHTHLKNDWESSVHVTWIPKFLDGTDPWIPEEYFELLAGADLTLFPSWYEPWGYTPMESVALGIPTVTSDLTGFSDWAAKFGNEDATGVFRIKRRQRTHREAVMELSEILLASVHKGRAGLAAYQSAALKLSHEGTWNKAISHYLDAHEQALEVCTQRIQAAFGPANVDSAYFSMEFAVIPDLHIYSGGLGVLAGDFLKAAQNLGNKVCGIGLAYREGYFRQNITNDLQQEVLPAEHASFEKNGLQAITRENGLPLQFSVPMPDGKEILSTAWKLEMGSSMLLLLDTDVEANPPELRALGRRLYTTDRKERWLQEYFLGTGGIRLLKILGIKPRWLHMNEGHTALLALEQMKDAIREKYLNFNEALQEMQSRTLFTTHTPVPAGHEEFDHGISQPEIDLIAAQLRVSPDCIWNLGRSHRSDSGNFSMTALALSVCSKVNAVSRRHRMSAERSMDGLLLEHKHLFSVTNGVHPQTWISPDWQRCLLKHLGADWTQRLNESSSTDFWSKTSEIPDEVIWGTHNQAKGDLLRWMESQMSSRDVAPSRAQAAETVLRLLRENDPKDLMVSVFARRFTAYKRPALLFSDIRRLRELIERYPKTLFIFSGKAHPADYAGQELIHRVLTLESSKDFLGHIFFLQDYGVAEAQLLVSGSDLWINVPQQPLEASGTSGMKAAMNGVLNLSVNDGWVPEATHGEVPWKIGEGSETLERSQMDWVHSQELYAFLESEIFPEYRSRNQDGLPTAWIARMKRAIAASIPRFSAQRMVREYADQTDWSARPHG